MSTGGPTLLGRHYPVPLSHQFVDSAMIAGIENDVAGRDTNGVRSVRPLLSLLIDGIVTAAQDRLEVDPLFFESGEKRGLEFGVNMTLPDILLDHRTQLRGIPYKEGWID